MTESQGRHASHAVRAPKPTRASRGPAPVPAPSERISTIGAGQGARVTTRRNAAETADRARRNAEERYYERHPEARATGAGPRRSAHNVVLIVVASVLALCAVFLLGRCAAGILAPSGDGEASRPEQTLRLTENEQALVDEQAQHDLGAEQVGTDGTVSYGGTSYGLATQEDGLWGLVATDRQGNATTLFEIEGTPVALVRNADTMLVPENRDGGWDIVCYVVDGHGQASYVMGDDGSMVQGEGEVTGVELDGSTLRVTCADGSTTDVALS